jgi:UDP-N-acetyl-D-mannosaminuronic acid dehydrogenase
VSGYISESLKGNLVVVGGGGHVGLPLSLVLADVGYNVTALDISIDTVEMVNSGVVPFTEDGASDLLKRLLNEKKFIATSDPKCLLTADIVIVVIGTPVDEHLSPDPNSVVRAVEELFPYLNDSQLVILRSTVFPGVLDRVEKVTKNIYPGIEVVYCPERIVEGQALRELRELPQIIGARNEKAFLRADEIFKNLSVATVWTSPEEAELAKLFTNVWRYVKFATANQFWMMANDLGIDYENVRQAIAYEYPRASDLPRAGFAAGPCLFKDTMQLSALVQQNFPLGNSAMMINEGTPGYLVNRLMQKYDLPNMTVGILGMAFKGDVDDTRSSLAFKLKKLLAFKCKEVLMSDPLVKDKRFIDYEEILEKSDILIIGAPHSSYKDLKINKPLIDIWNITGNGVLI